MKFHGRFLIIILELMLILSFILLTSACNVSEKEAFMLDELKRLDNIDRVEITHRNDFTSDSYHIKTVDNPNQVNSIVQNFRVYSDNWQKFYPYAPPGLLHIEFYNGDKRELGLMIGYTNKTSSGETFFHLSKAFGPGRPLKEREFKELMALLNIDEKLAYYD